MAVTRPGSEPHRALAAAWADESVRRERWEGLVFTVLPFVLHPIWVAFDYVLEPAWSTYLVWRGLDEVVGGIALVVLWFGRDARTIRRTVTVSVASSGLATAMLLPLSVHYTAYVLGYSLIVWGAGTLFSATVGRAGLLQGLLTGAFVVAHMVQPHQLDTETLVGSAFYIATAWFVCGFSLVLRYRLQKTAFDARWRLDQRNGELQTALTRLADTESQLRRAKEGLEDQVAERTQALSESLTRLEHENAERIAAEARAESASRAKSAFLATMSHELRTPLNAILGYTEIAVEELGGPQHAATRQDLGQVETAASHLLGIIDDVLDLARVEAGCVALKTRVVPVAPLLQRAADLVRPAASARGNRVELEFDERAARVRADPDRLRQVVANLLSNAAKFTENGRIALGCAATADEGEIELFVADTGIGIAEDHHERIFERFYQVDGTCTRRYGGTGLGLAICRELVGRMGGRIVVHSREGEGTTFRIRLPVGGPVSDSYVAVAGSIGPTSP
ncbi:MAG: HAMP domain-containing sensor histidine kinase [Myxococcota bacterium]